MQDLAMPAKTLETYNNRSEVGQNLKQNKVTKDERFSIAAHCKTFGIEEEKLNAKSLKHLVSFRLFLRTVQCHITHIELY